MDYFIWALITTSWLYICQSTVHRYTCMYMFIEVVQCRSYLELQINTYTVVSKTSKAQCGEEHSYCRCMLWTEVLLCQQQNLLLRSWWSFAASNLEKSRCCRWGWSKTISMVKASSLKACSRLAAIGDQGGASAADRGNICCRAM